MAETNLRTIGNVHVAETIAICRIGLGGEEDPFIGCIGILVGIAEVALTAQCKGEEHTFLGVAYRLGVGYTSRVAIAP